MLAAGDLGGLAEDAVNALGQQLVIHIADGRAGRETRRGVALAAFGRDPQLGDRAFLALEFGSVMHEFLRLARGVHDRLQVAILLDGEARNRLAGLGYAIDDALGPARLDPDDDAGRHVRIGAGADHGAEMQVEIGAELQPAIGMRQGHRALDVVGDTLAGGVGDIVDRQDHDMVAHADTAIGAAIALECVIGVFRSHQAALTSAWFSDCGHGHARLRQHCRSCGRHPRHI